MKETKINIPQKFPSTKIYPYTVFDSVILTECPCIVTYRMTPLLVHYQWGRTSCFLLVYDCPRIQLMRRSQPVWTKWFMILASPMSQIPGLVLYSYICVSHVCMYVCVLIHVCTCMLTCGHTHTHTHTYVLIVILFLLLRLAHHSPVEYQEDRESAQPLQWSW